MKLIKLSEKEKEDTIKKFDKEVAEARTKLLTSDRVTQTFEFKYTPPADLSVPEEQKTILPKPKIIMSATTYLKMLQYVLKIDVECAWHGFVTKHPNAIYTIDDVKMYPHKGSAAYVESDDDRYPQWEATLTNEQYLSRRFQAHSHVNMAVSPSGTDVQNQKDFMNDLINLIETDPDKIESYNPFYIFAIMNKKQEINWFLYDYSLGILFEKEDIDFTIYYSEDVTNLTLNEEIQEMPTKTAPVYNAYNAYNGYNGYSAQNAWTGYNRYNHIDDDDFSDDKYIHKPNITTPSQIVKKKNQIWEIRCTSDTAQKDFLNSNFYKTHKNLLFTQKRDVLQQTFFYALDDNAAKKINFKEFKESAAYTEMGGVFLSEVDRPKWYPPTTTHKNLKVLDKLLLDIMSFMDLGETPYVVLDKKTGIFDNINKRHNEILDIIGEKTKITLTNNQEVLCFCITDIDFIEDEHLKCIRALQLAGMPLRGIKLKETPKPLKS